MKRIAVLPTVVTLGNAVCGFIAITHLLMAYGCRENVILFKHHMELACTLVFGAMVCDALDGSVARLAKVSSEFGAQLDSLADAISFGCVPAAIVWMMTYEGLVQRLAWLTALLFLSCAIMRLARYNIESGEREGPTLHFAGLPTPAAAGLVASLALIHFYVSEEKEFGLIRANIQSIMEAMVDFMPLVATLAALLMVSRIPFTHIVNVALREHEPFDYVVRIVIVVMFAVFTWPFSLPLAFSLYVALGLASWAARGFRPDVAARVNNERE